MAQNREPCSVVVDIVVEVVIIVKVVIVVEVVDVVRGAARMSKLFLIILFSLRLLPSPGNCAASRRASDFGGDFSAGSLSGSEAPGPTAGTMGNQAAAAMGIGTGGMGPGDYTSSYKTPNYTQYTQQDFKGLSMLKAHYTGRFNMPSSCCRVFRAS